MGSLKPELGPGAIVVPDQVVDRTWGREHTVYDAVGPVVHVAFADPYLGPVARPQDHVYTPVRYMDAVNAINFHEPSHLFIATLWRSR